jgi:type I protein arginine methyltransferase
MLKDTVRTDAYRDFIYDNKNLFKDKIVLDVGCGTGILSMFCAKAGAKKVIAVDNSEIINKTRANVFENKLDNIITCLHGKIEELTLPVEKVDIIVSEWMGYCLLYEGMLDSVLYARDRYLSPTGLMVPSHCTLVMSTLHDPEYINDHISFWKEVYGFSMTSMLEKIHEDAQALHMPLSTISSEPFIFKTLPLHTITLKELDFVKNFEVTVTKDDVDSLDGFIIWFDNFFLTSRDDVLPADARAETWKGKGNAFTTGPGGKETHWREGVLLIDNVTKGSKGNKLELKKGQQISGSIEYKKRDTNSRELDIEVAWKIKGDEKENKQLWFVR